MLRSRIYLLLFLIIQFFLIQVINIFSSFAAFPKPWQVNFQTAASPFMQELHVFHNFLLIIGFGIILLVLVLLAYVIYKFNAKRNPVPAKFSHNVAIEILWTIIPVLILIIIAIPSFRILKVAEEIPTPELIVKVLGSQWYWTYSYPDHNNIEFSSYIIQDADLKKGQKRLLDVDNRMVVPVNATIKFLITGADVIHSFSVPSLGIKMDAVPGKVNETWTKIEQEGTYYGQCSEICGPGHGFMPIAIEAVSKEAFNKWLEDAKGKFSGS